MTAAAVVIKITVNSAASLHTAKALLVWPFLVVGTVAGTALLITLPLGAAVWWLTLILARSAARLEVSHHFPTRLQVRR